ncbi:ATP-binding cassette domain-containing protein [Nocardioides insulae]|uniref:ATP-binding cassette domain-containing protein n=1 Tax=Nocardioides insulae TaxID=394734 RepID=UPI00042444CB|nr:ATP-binding cassette domain-containing protein [Nocardioides insulae]
MITGTDLSFRYDERAILAGVELTAQPGRVLGLIGPNGAGKTTLLRLLYGALRSPTGEVRVDGDPLASINARETARRLAVVVQESGTDTTLTAAELVLLGRIPHLSTFQRAGARDHEIATTALERVGVSHLGRRPFAALSGGERQRVLIARALAQEATHLLLDEPTNHLDIRYQHELLELVSNLGTTSVVVLHDLNLAARYCDDLVLLGTEHLVAAGPTSEVLRPELLEPVYGIGVQRLDLDGGIHLIFHPHGSKNAPANTPPHASALASAHLTEDLVTSTSSAPTVQDRINDYWTMRAPEYDAYQRRPERREVDLAAWSEIWSEALPSAPADVLDLGTGSGYVAFVLAQLGHRTTGIDLAEGMLAAARAHAAELPAEVRPTFAHGDAVKPPYPPASFDAVVGRYVAWTLREAKDAAVNWHDLLRPGGTLALVDSTWFPEGIAPDGMIADQYDASVQASLPLHDADSIERTADVVRAAGFVDVEVTPLTTILELDRSHGVAPGHEVQTQYLITGRRA